MEALTTTNNKIVNTQELSANLYNEFLQYIEASPKTIETYSRAIKQFIKYMADNGITRPTRDDVIAFRDELKENHKPTTVQNYIVAIRLFFNWTSQAGYYPNIAEHVKGAKLNREHKKDYLTSAQIKDVLQSIDQTTAEGIRDYALISLILAGGLRTIEVNRALIEDIRTIGNTTVLYLQGKGREEKTEYVKLAQPVEKALRSYLATRENVTDEQPLFISTSNNSKGEALSTRTIRGIIKETFRKAGYDSERLTAHSLRHTAVTLALLGGAKLEEAQQFARHSNIQTTQIYAHNLDRLNNQCESNIASAIWG